MDRIDIQKEVHLVDFFAISDQKSCCSSEELRLKVERVRKIQQDRYSSWSNEIIVIQAGKASGALITAEYSRKYGRKVF